MTHTMPQTKSVELATGLRLHYVEQGEPGGRPIVMLHGWPDSWFTFSRVLPHLDARYRVYALDQRGFGESDKTASSHMIDDFAADVTAFLDAVGEARATIVGHSFGTFVARRVAELDPERVDALVLIGTAVSAVNDVTREVSGELANLPDPVPEAFAREFQESTVHAPVPPEFFDQIIVETLKLPSPLWAATFDAMFAFDDREMLPRLTAPTLLVWGDHDGLFSRADQDALLSLLPNAQLVVYDDTGHCPNGERPDRVAADVDEFLREH